MSHLGVELSTAGLRSFVFNPSESSTHSHTIRQSTHSPEQSRNASQILEKIWNIIKILDVWYWFLLIFHYEREKTEAREERCVGGRVASSHSCTTFSSPPWMNITRSAAAIYMCFRGRGCEADENVRKFAKKNFLEMLGMSRDFCAVANTIIFLLLKLSTSPVLGRGVGAVWQQFDIQNTPHTSYTGEKAGERWGGDFGGEKRKIHKNLIRNWII